MRRGTLLPVAAVLIGLTLLFGCNRRQDPSPPPTEPSSIQPSIPPESSEATAAEEDAPSSAALDYRGVIRESSVTEGENVLLQIYLSVPAVDGLPAASAYYEAWLGDREYEALLEEDAARQRYAEATENGGIFFPYTYESDFTVLRNDGVLFSVLRDFYENTGGVRPGYRLMAECFVAEDGSMLILDDVFTVDAPAYRGAIRDAVLALLPEKVEEMGQDPYYQDVADIMMEVFDNRDFSLTEDSLIVFWQTAAIAPVIAGVQQFDIPLALLADIIDPRWLP